MRHLVIALCVILYTHSAQVHSAESGLQFQKPGSARTQSTSPNQNFRRPAAQRSTEAQEVTAQATKPQANKPRTATKKVTATPHTQRREQVVNVAAKPLPKPKATVRAKNKSRSNPVIVEREVAQEAYIADDLHDHYDDDIDLTVGLQLASHGCALCDGPCTCEAACGLPEPSCGLYEPGCGIAEPACGCSEPGCGICEPGCGIGEPGCGIGEPNCGCGDVGCGSCVGRPGPDYWCFPICLPRFKDLSIWGGVQGFRGPRDFANQRSDSNFGFHEGFNLSGRAPLVSLVFPQLSYQLGYQAMQSRLHGTATSTDDRMQQFVTAGFFRRVNTGLQFGVVWDLLEDDLDTDIDLHQMRYEISLKSPQGREIGFFGTSSTNDATSLGVLYETVDQYALFYRWLFGNGYESRLWGGATGDGEGLFGGEFYAPLNNRWSVQSGFNYLITDENDGLPGVSQESWNIGINVVWHLGQTARRGCRSPYRPLFGVADNGWMFVDRAQ